MNSKEELNINNWSNSNIGGLYKNIKNTLNEARSKAYSSVDFYMV